jgi:release factor glutamine methyltransferase
MTLAARRATGPPVAPAAPAVPALLRGATERLAAAGIATARQDAETFLARALGTSRLGLYTTPCRAVPAGACAAFEGLLARRARHEPVQYLLGEAEFSGLVLAVGRDVFIPRPETEALVDRALSLDRPAATVVDVCTGSGALACALAVRRPAWAVWAVERAAAAAACARANVRRLGLARRVQVLTGDLFAPLRGQVAAGTVDLIVTNPPYLAQSLLPALPVEVRDWEPREALDGGPDGLAVIRRVLAEAPDWLSPGGGLLMEIGEEHGPGVRALTRGGPWARARVHRDLRGCERVLEAWRR